jgi:glutamine cyclotransferase
VTRDGGCFTQGLYFTPSGSLLVESCGIYGASRVRTVSLENGSYVETASAKNNASDFGEGATQWPPTAAQGASILQLTWQERAVVVWDAATLQVTARVPFKSISGEGWGLTSDGAGELVASDGSDFLQFLKPDVAAAVAAGSFAPLRPPLPVIDGIPHSEGWEPPGGAPNGTGWAPRALVRPKSPSGIANGSHVFFLNEMEWVHGWLIANIWRDPRVAIIHPRSGAVVWYFDFAPLLAENPGADVTNGLAYTMRLDAAAPAAAGARPPSSNPTEGEPWGGRLWVTGKFWTHVYELELGGLVNASLIASPPPPGCPASLASPSSNPAPPSPTISLTASPTASPNVSLTTSPTTSPAGSATGGSVGGSGAPSGSVFVALGCAAAGGFCAAAAVGGARRWRLRGGAPRSSHVAFWRANPASASSRATLHGDVHSVWQTAAEGGAGSAAAVARAAALREVLLLRGDAPLPPTPEETA